MVGGGFQEQVYPLELHYLGCLEMERHRFSLRARQPAKALSNLGVVSTSRAPPPGPKMALEAS